MTYKPKVLSVSDGGTGLSATTANQLLYSSGTSTIAGLASANNGILATNGSGVPSITTAAGNFLNTSRCCFSAYKSSSTANATGDGTSYTVIHDTVVFDQGSNYNNSTGTFTAPVTGRYLLIFSVDTISYAAQNTGQMQIVTTSQTYNGNTMNWGANAVTTNEVGRTMTVIANMTSGNTATTVLAIYNGTKTISVVGDAGTKTFFQGFLIC